MNKDEKSNRTAGFHFQVFIDDVDGKFIRFGEEGIDAVSL